VTASDLAAWRAERTGAGLAPASLSVYIRAVRGWFHWLYRRGEIFFDAAAELRPPRVARCRLGVPSVAEIRTLLDDVEVDCGEGIRDRAILETAYATGLRRNELASLRTTDVDLSQRTLRVVGKGSRERVVPITGAAAMWLRRYLEAGRSKCSGIQATDALWLNRRGRPLAAASLARIIGLRARASGLRHVTPHTLRRACATHMLSNGAHPADLQQLLGHSSFQHLSHYLQLGFRELQATHAASRPGR
jgi:site-specific recombinase XerD